jgi:hypothetical protein
MLSHAVQLARRWADANGASIWHVNEGTIVQMLPEDDKTLR